MAHLFVRVNVDVTFDALLTHVGPTVTRHPLSFAFRTFVLSKASLLTLVRRQTLALRPRLQNQNQYQNQAKYLYAHNNLCVCVCLCVMFEIRFTFLFFIMSLLCPCLSTHIQPIHKVIAKYFFYPSIYM